MDRLTHPRCTACARDYTYVPPNGPVPARVMVVGEAPARREVQYGYPFAGESGDELNGHYLPLASLRRRDVYATNAAKCSRPGFVNPTKSEAAACAACHLGTELRLVRPQVVVTLGAVAASLFGADLEHSHGVPYRGVYEHWEGWCFSTYHPAQGIRVPQLIGRIRTGFIELGKLLAALDRGGYTPPQDACPNPEYRELSRAGDLCHVLSPQPGDPPYIGVDTESDTVDGMAGAPPWCLTLSPRPGTGYLIRASAASLLGQFGGWLRRRGMTAILHHALHDIPVSLRMGVTYPRWTDSMQMAYILQDVPMGLKPLAYRLCGMTMRDWEDVVHPHARKVADSYMTDAVHAIGAAWRDSHILKSGPRKGESELQFVPGTPPAVRGAYNRATALLRALRGETPCKVPLDSKDGDGDEKEVVRADPWKRWDNWSPEVRDRMVEIMGRPLPRPSITQAPFDEALAYACLSNESRVLTPTGYMRIGDMVRRKYGGDVIAYDESASSVVVRPVVGWHRIEHRDRVQWWSVETEHDRRGRWGPDATRYTADHRVLTPRGWAEVSKLKRGQKLFLPYRRLNGLQKQVVYGSLLGDGCITRRNAGGWASLHITHAAGQRQYLWWKASILDDLITNYWTQDAGERHIAGSMCVAQESITVDTLRHPELGSLRDESYTTGGRSVGGWIGNLGALGLAVFYQDNGTLVGGVRPRLYTQRYSPVEVDLIRHHLLRMGIDSTRYAESRSGKPVIHVRAHSAGRFFSLVAPYMHPVMNYKLPIAYQAQFAPPPVANPCGLLESVIREVGMNPIPESRRGSLCTSYCIDVEGVHNFFTPYHVVRNCRDADATGRVYPELRKRFMGREVRKEIAG